MNGWRYRRTNTPTGYHAEKDGWVVSSENSRQFTVTSPRGDVIAEDLGTSLEAQRMADACIRRDQK